MTPPAPRGRASRRLARSLAFAAAGVAAVGALVVVAVPSLISSELARKQIAALAEGWTGHAATFGAASVSLRPFLSVRFADVRIGGEDGAEPLLTAPAVSGRVSLLPLLLGRVEIAGLTLERPAIRLAEPPAWRDAGALPPAFGSIAIVDGSIRIGGGPVELTGINATLSFADASGRAAASGSFVWHGEPVEASATLGAPAALAAGGASPLRFAVASTPLRLTFEGEAGGDTAALAGALSVTTPSLRHAVDWAGMPMAADDPTLGAGSLAGQLAFADGIASVDAARLELDGNSAEGVLSFAFEDGRPTVRGTLALKALDLSPYAESFAASLRAAGSLAAAPVAVPLLDAVDFDVRLSAADVLLGAARLGPVAASAVIGGNRLAVEIAPGDLYGGSARGQLIATRSGASVAARLEASMEDVALGSLIADFGGSAVSGQAGGRIAVAGEGATWGELLGSLAGTAGLTLADAALPGLDPARLGLAGAALRFSRIAADFTFADGFARAATVMAEGDGLSVAMRGSASLLHPTIAGRGAVSLGDPAAPQAVAFLLSGTWAEPVLSPDPDALVPPPGDAALATTAGQ